MIFAVDHSDGCKYLSFHELHKRMERVQTFEIIYSSIFHNFLIKFAT